MSELTSYLPALLAQCIKSFPQPGPSSRNRNEDETWNLVPAEKLWPAAFHFDGKALEGRHILVRHTEYRYFDYWISSSELFKQTASLQTEIAKIEQAVAGVFAADNSPAMALCEIQVAIEKIKALIGDRRLEDLPDHK
jgi:hypothetical protein